MNTQEYLDQVLQVIRERFRPTDSSGSMPVATVAYLVRQRLGVDHTPFGFAKFKDVLSDLESRNLIRTGSNTKQAFALWLVGSPTTVVPSPGFVAAANTPFRPLRNQVWFAFISESPPGRRFLNRVSGEVRVGLQDAPDAHWVEIIPIDASKEKEEASRFLSAHQLNSRLELQQSLSSEKWYVDLPAAIGTTEPQLASEWKRERSNRVVSLVEKWRSDNSVDEHLVYERQPPRSADRVELYPSSGLRQCLLSAIQRMPTDKLLELDIPARLLTAVIRPELLDN